MLSFLAASVSVLRLLRLGWIAPCTHDCTSRHVCNLLLAAHGGFTWLCCARPTFFTCSEPLTVFAGECCPCSAKSVDQSRSPDCAVKLRNLQIVQSRCTIWRSWFRQLLQCAQSRYEALLCEQHRLLISLSLSAANPIYIGFDI